MRPTWSLRSKRFWRRASPAAGALVLFLVSGAGPSPGPARAAPAAPERRPAPRPSAGGRRAVRGSLLWPLEIPGVLLSTFAEYRYDHLHAGVDISTRGGTGYKVRAAESGSIYRLKVEWRGYGRALYIQHAGGRVTVYGHLKRYEDRLLHLERRVARRQAEARTRYPGDIYLDPPLPVRRGQVVAYSGESGVGLPHLHFEVRDGDDAPLDPFAAGLAPPEDRRRPVLESLTITAASETTFVDGALREQVYPLVEGAGAAAPSGPVRVSGPFLAAVSAYDPAGPDGKAGIASLEMAIDGRTVYHLAPRSFRFEQYPQAGLIFDHRRSRLGPAQFTYRLLRLPGNQLAEGGPAEPAPRAESAAEPGALDLPAGMHRMEIRAGDEAGNRSRAVVCLLVGHPGTPRAWRDGDGSRGGVLVHFALADAAAPPRPEAKGAGDGGCVAGGPGVEAEIWSGEGERFQPLSCSLREGACLAPRDAGVGDRTARLREVRDGVQGPWVLALPEGAVAAVPPASEPTLEAWPGFLDVMLALDAPVVPELRLTGGPEGATLAPFLYRDGLRCGASIDHRRLAGAEPLAIAAPGAPGGVLARLAIDARFLGPQDALTYRGPGFEVRLPAGSRFFPGPLLVRAVPTAGESRLPAMSDAVELLPEGEALNERATLAFELSDAVLDPRALGIYRWDSFHARWTYEGGDVDSTGRALTLAFRRYGRFALLQDASPPVVGAVSPPAGARNVGRRPPIWAHVEEDGEGLDFDGVAFVLDGRPLESEFDPDRGLSKVLDVPDLSPGPHRLEIRATDKAGNLSDPAEVAFEVR